MANLIYQLCVYHFPNQNLRHIPHLKTPTLRQKRLFITSSLSDLHPLTVSLSPIESSSSSSMPSFTVKYLMNSCGLSLKDALSASQKFQLQEYKSQNYESVLSLLRSYDFSDAHIQQLLIKYPQILKFRLQNNLIPKLHYLTENGFVGPLLPELILANPAFLFRSLSHHIKPTIEILRKYIRTNERIVDAVNRSSWLLSSSLKKVTQRNLEFLLSEGVTATTIENLIVMQPRTVMMKFYKFARAVKIVKKLGLNPSSSTCVKAIRLIVSLSDSAFKKKVELFKSFGWSEEEIMTAFKRDPLFLSGSEEKIRNTMDFFVNTMKLNPNDVTVYPKLLMYGLNTRIRPRYKVLKVLESKNLLRTKKILWLFTISEKMFLKSFVHKNLDYVPDLMEIYVGAIGGDKIDNESTTN